MDIEKVFLNQNPLTLGYLPKIKQMFQGRGCLSLLGPKGFGGVFYLVAIRRHGLNQQKPSRDVDCRLIANKHDIFQVRANEPPSLTLFLSHFECLSWDHLSYLRELYDCGKIHQVILFAEYSDQSSKAEAAAKLKGLDSHHPCIQFNEFKSDLVMSRYYIDRFLLSEFTLSKEVLRFITEYDWPGNLEQFLGVAFRLKGLKPQVVGLDDVTDLVGQTSSIGSPELLNSIIAGSDLKLLVRLFGYPGVVKAFDASILRVFLDQYEGCQSRVARHLSIAPTTLRSKVFSMKNLLDVR